jgi:hypothetical protein
MPAVPEGGCFHRARYPKLRRGSDEEQCGLYYDQHQVWRVTVVVTLPDTLPCVLRGGSGTDGQGQFLTRMLA